MCGQFLAHCAWIGIGPNIVGYRQRRHGRHEGRGERGSRQILPEASAARSPDTHTGCGEVDVVAPVCLLEDGFVLVDCGHRDHIAIGGGIGRGRRWSTVTCRRDHQDAMYSRALDRRFNQKIGFARQADVDNRHAVGDHPIQRADDCHGARQ